MRRHHLFLTAAAAGLAAQALAQDAQPGQPPAGLSDLQDTVSTLQDEAPQQQEQAEPAPTPAPPAAPTPAPPAPPAANAPPLTQAQIAEINRAAARGRELIALTRAGILATQDMLARVANPEATGIDGWIALPEGNAMTVTFYDNQESGPKTVYRANILGNRVVSRDTFLGTHRPDLPRALARLAAARDAARAEDNRTCSPQGANFLVVPPGASGGPVEVYEISAQTSRERLPAGGHYRMTVSDGRVTATHAFAAECQDVAIPAAAEGQAPPPLAIAASDPLPSEVHVLLSQMAGRALAFTAGTPPRQWIVAGDRINEVRDGAPRQVNSQD